jgi:hypothetical protein
MKVTSILILLFLCVAATSCKKNCHCVAKSIGMYNPTWYESWHNIQVLPKKANDVCHNVCLDEYGGSLVYYEVE